MTFLFRRPEIYCTTCDDRRFSPARAQAVPAQLVLYCKVAILDAQGRLSGLPTTHTSLCIPLSLATCTCITAMSESDL